MNIRCAKAFDKTAELSKQAFKYPLILTAALLCCSVSIAQVGPSSEKKPTQVGPLDSGSKVQLTDQSFVEKAALGGLGEVEVSKLAVEKTTNKKIKKFASTMITDHEKSNIKLKQIATTNRLSLPAGLTSDQQKLLAELKALSGENFDRAYVDIMKKDHDTTVGLFDNAAGEAKLNPELRVFANQALPALRGHQKTAHALIDMNTKPKAK